MMTTKEIFDEILGYLSDTLDSEGNGIHLQFGDSRAPNNFDFADEKNNSNPIVASGGAIIITSNGATLSSQPENQNMVRRVKYTELKHITIYVGYSSTTRLPDYLLELVDKVKFALMSHMIQKNGIPLGNPLLLMNESKPNRKENTHWVTLNFTLHLPYSIGVS